MIVRVLQGRVKADCIDCFRSNADEALERTRRHSGCSFAQVGRQVHADGSEEVVFMSVWAGLDEIYDWVGGSDLLGSPMISGSTPDVFAYFDIQHYEVLDPIETGFPGSVASAVDVW